jgi:dipeptidyl aminopeptidase/acylaminoacyl peptidase
MARRRIGLRPRARLVVAIGALAPATMLGIGIGGAFSAGARPRSHVPEPPLLLGRPSWSPTRDELQLNARIDERELCGTPDGVRRFAAVIVDSDGANLRRLPHGAGGLWSPDGNLLATDYYTLPPPYTRLTRDLGIVTRAGREIHTEEYAEASSWAADSKRLAINLYDPTDSPDVAAILDLRNGDVRKIAGYPSGYAVWAPRGDLIAYGEPNGYLYVEHGDGRGRRRVMREPSAFAWSGDGGLIAAQNELRRRWGPVFVVDPRGRNRRRMTAGDAVWSWSPRGRVLALDRDLIDLARRSRRRVLPRSLKPVVLDPGLVLNGAPGGIWSPDGRRIGYATRTGIYVVDADGSRGHLIKWPVRPISEPSWSPHGTTLAFATRGGVYLVRFDGRGGHYLPAIPWCDLAKAELPSPRRSGSSRSRGR